MTSRIGISIVFVLILSSLIPTTQGIDTGIVENPLNKMETTIPITIHLWGFDESLEVELNSILPTTLVQEAFYPIKPEISRLQVSFDGSFNGLQNLLDIKIVRSTAFEFQPIVDSLQVQHLDDSSSSNPLNISEIFTGRSISRSSLNSHFNPHNELNRYNIHVTNFTALDSPNQNRRHWFTIGSTQVVSLSSQDLRNVILLGDRSILVDPTGIAPYFGFTPDNITMNSNPVKIASSVLDVVEEIIVGSPMSYWLTPIERELHVAKIAIGVDGNDIEFRLLQDASSFSRLDTQVKLLFPGYDLKTSNLDVNLNLDSPILADYLRENTQKIDDQDVIIVDLGFAEIFKSEVRKLYDKFPTRYYMGLFFFVDDSHEYLIETEDQGLQPYSVGQIGFSMDHISEWYRLSPSQITDQRVTYRVMRLLGENFGLPFYSKPTTRQIDSPMSDYGVTTEWNGLFNSFEVDSIQRRNAVSLNTRLTTLIQNEINRVEGSFVPGYSTSTLENLKAEVIDIKSFEDGLNYSYALEAYNEHYDMFEIELENVSNARNFVNYGSILLSSIIVLAYYSKILSDDSFSKKEFKRRIENLRQFNKELEEAEGYLDPVNNAKKPIRK